MATSSSTLSALSATPLLSRPSYIQGMEDDREDIFDVVSVGLVFKYIIPSFDVLTLDLRHMKIVGQHQISGDEKRYNLLIRNDSSLLRSYPARMTVVVIEATVVYLYL